MKPLCMPLFDSLEFAETIKKKNKFMGSELNLPTSIIKFTITSILYVKMLHSAVHNKKKLNKSIQPIKRKESQRHQLKMPNKRREILTSNKTWTKIPARVD